jgi:hypothetical protein
MDIYCKMMDVILFLNIIIVGLKDSSIVLVSFWFLIGRIVTFIEQILTYLT